MTLMMMDVERVEVLKGPQGTLYGRNSSGGAINIHSAKPTRELDGFIDVSYGDYETARLEGIWLGLRLTSGPRAEREALALRQNDAGSGDTLGHRTVP